MRWTETATFAAAFACMFGISITMSHCSAADRVAGIKRAEIEARADVEKARIEAEKQRRLHEALQRQAVR